MHHVLTSIIYAIVVLLALLAYSVITDAPLLILLLLSPFIVSGVVIAVMVLDLVVMATRWSWSRCNRG